MSTTVTVKEQVAELLEPSVTLKVLVVTPTGKEVPLDKPAICVVTEPEQLSVPPGVVKVTVAAHNPRLAFTLILAGQVIAGG